MTTSTTKERMTAERLNRGGPSARLLATLALWLAGLGACVSAPPEASGQVAAALVDTCSGIPDGALCNDQNACTTGDTCISGVCVGTPAVEGTPCTDGNQCTGGDACHSGTCRGDPGAEGAPCTDGEGCAEPDTCRA